MSDDIFAFPVGRNHDFTAVRTYVVFFSRYVRRIVFETAAPSITYVDVDRVAVSVSFPYSRHLKVVPTFIVEAGFPEICGACICIPHPEEFPGSVQAHKVLGVFLDCLGSHFCIFVRKEVCVHRCPVDGIYFRVLPFFKCLCIARKHTGT